VWRARETHARTKVAIDEKKTRATTKCNEKEKTRATGGRAVQGRRMVQVE